MESESVIGELLSSTREICRRYLLIFLIGAIVVPLVCGGIEIHAGGPFWLGVKWGLSGWLYVAFVVYSFAMFNASRGYN
ncbi:MAG: hypothetical protein P4L53_09135 [Candidatus Obscuribacterales bacterium]|nr:hypothetical protein [Candidatus Obscuribacterales bacterium]